MFEVNAKEVLLKSVTLRTEKHGEEPKPACTLRVKLTGPNSLLDLIDGDLIESLYEAREEPKQGELLNRNDLRFAKYPALKPLKLDLEMPDYRVRIVNEMAPEEAKFILPDCTLKNFEIEPSDGGSVHISFNINCEPEAEAIGWFYKAQKHNITITLQAPEEQEMEEFEEAED